jgi:hypothetical protein
MNANNLRKKLIPKVEALAKKNGFDYIWIDPLSGSDTLYRKGGGDVNMFFSSLERYYLEEMETKKWIEMVSRDWYNVNNFFILDLLKLLKPIREKYGLKSNDALGGKISRFKSRVSRLAKTRKTKE